MKKKILAFAMLGFLSGCVRTDDATLSSAYMDNPNVQSFVDKQVEITSDNYQQLKTSVYYSKIILEEPINYGKVIGDSTTTLFLTNKEYIELLNNMKIKKVYSSSFFVPSVYDGEFSETNNIYSLKQGVSRKYISEISENVDLEGNTTLEIKNDSVFSGIRLEIEFDEKEFNGSKKDIVKILIHEEKLVALDNIEVNEDLYIQSPKKEHSSIESTVAFGDDGHFIKYDGGKNINILSFLKKDKEIKE